MQSFTYALLLFHTVFFFMVYFEILKKFLNSNGKIINRKRTGVTAKNQRKLAMAVKHARFMGLLPFVAR